MFLWVLERIATALDAHRIPYMVIGGQAVLRYGEPRQTKDIDITHKIVAGRPRDLEDARIILIKNPEVETAYIRDWLRQFEESLGDPYLAQLEKVMQ